MKGADQSSRIERQILLYLVDHPAAKDTIAGIFEWWLKSPQEWSQRAVEEVIENLVARCWMTVTPLKTGVPLFGLNADAHDAVVKAVQAGNIDEGGADWRT